MVKCFDCNVPDGFVERVSTPRALLSPLPPSVEPRRCLCCARRHNQRTTQLRRRVRLAPGTAAPWSGHCVRLLVTIAALDAYPPHRIFACAQPDKTPGMQDVRRFGWFGEVIGEKPCARCSAKGTLRCPRCKGAKKLNYRSAAWR